MILRSSQWIDNILLMAVCWVVLLKATMAGFPLSNGPNPDFQAIMFDESVNFRQNVCHLQQQYDNGTALLENSLKGLNISSVFECPNQYCIMKGDDLDPDYPGIFVDLLEEVARRAGFNWRDGYALVDPDQKGNRTFDELLAWSVETYDLAVSWWTETSPRIRLGIEFPDGWYESDIVMISKRPDNVGATFQFNSFLLPFEGWLWAAIISTIVLSGIVYYLLEVLDHRSDKRRLEQSPIENIFITGVAFTTHFEYHPRTKAAWLFALSVSFWAMIVGSAYTANLASFFVVQNTPMLQVQSVEDAVSYGYTICVWKSTGTDTILTSDFRRGNFIRKSDDTEVLQGVLDGECQVAVLSKGSWDTKKHEYCELEWIGRKYKEIPAGFAARHDSGTKCSSLISMVVAIHFRDMLDEGFVKNTWEGHLKKKLIRPACASIINLEETDSENQRLTLKSMGGIFILHGAVSIFVLIVTIIMKYSGGTEKRNKRLAMSRRQLMKQTIQERSEIKNAIIASDPKIKMKTSGIENYQAENDSEMFLDCIEEYRESGSSDGEYNTVGNYLMEDVSLFSVGETIHQLRSEMQRSQSQLSAEIQKSQREQQKDITEIRGQMASIAEVQSAQQEMKDQMASILNLLNK